MRPVALGFVTAAISFAVACAPSSDPSEGAASAGASSPDGGAVRSTGGTVQTPSGAPGNDASAPAGDDDDEDTGNDTAQHVAFPSPTIVRDGATYHMYVAKRLVDGKPINAPHFVGDANGHWKYVGDALTKLNPKVRQDGKKYVVWAPAAAKIGEKRWVLHYSATLDESTGQKKCLFRAHADDPNGPFVDDSADALYCAPGTLWAIDPSLVQDAATKDWYLAARIDEPGGINTIKIRKLAPNGLDFGRSSDWATLTRSSPDGWEQPVLENASVVSLAPSRGGAAHWFVFYSGGAWSDDSYAIGYADCGTSIVGPCTKKTVKGPWMATDAAQGVHGPGTPTFYTDEAGATLMSIQAWKYPNGTANPENTAIGQVMRTYVMTASSTYEP